MGNLETKEAATGCIPYSAPLDEILLLKLERDFQGYFENVH